MIVILPFVQLIILVYAASFEMKKIDMVIVDQDLSTISRRLTSKFEGSPFFHLYGFTYSMSEAEKLLTSDQADLIIKIPVDFEKNLMTEKKGRYNC